MIQWNHQPPFPHRAMQCISYVCSLSIFPITHILVGIIQVVVSMWLCAQSRMRWWDSIRQVMLKDRRSGRPHVTSRQNDNFLRVSVLRSRLFKTAKELNVQLEHANPPGRCRISDQTVRQLHQQGLKARWPVVKQNLSAAHKAARLRGAVAHR